MNVTAANPSSPPQASDLPPEISAFLDAAMARAAGSATTRRPVAPIVHHVFQDAPLRLPRLNVPKRQARVLALDDLVLVGLFVGLLLAAWVSLLIGLDIAQAAERTTGLCMAQAQSAPGRPASDRSPCARLPQQG